MKERGNTRTPARPISAQLHLLDHLPIGEIHAISGQKIKLLDAILYDVPISLIGPARPPVFPDPTSY